METLEPYQALDEPPSLEHPAEEPQTLEAQIEEPESQKSETLAEEHVETLDTVSSKILYESFAVGDFVWGEIKNQPWWPGRVYDPEFLPEKAKRALRRSPNAVFVVYFGNDTFVWCHPMQLKPFEQEFSKMVTQSTSKSFVTAVDNALEEIGRCLELEMACSCMEVEVPDGFLKQESEKVSIKNCAVEGFLKLVHDVAKDALVTDMLEITMLRSWVLAFTRGRGHQRRGIIDLIDKIDLDTLPRESMREDDGGGESWVDEVVKKPEILEEKYKRRKKRSMAKLIAEMDLNAVEVSEDEEGEEEKEGEVKVEVKGEDRGEEEKREDKEEEKEKEKEVVPDEEQPELQGEDKHPELVNAGVDNVVVGEGTESGKRERKKSKYLSYPYTSLITFGKQDDLELKSPKKASETLTILGSNSDKFEKEEEQKGSMAKLDSVSAREILSELIAAGIDSFHLKWNRSARLIRGFFAAYRSSVYSDGSEFKSYQKHTSESGYMNGSIPAFVKAGQLMGDGTSPGSKKRKSGATGKTLSLLDNIVKDGSLQGKSGTDSKMGNDGTDVVVSLDQKHDEMDRSGKSKASHKKKVRKNEAGSITASDVGPEKMGGSEKAKTSRGRKSKKDAATEGTLLDSGCDTKEHPGQSLTGLKKQIRNNGANGGAQVNVAVEILNGLEKVDRSGCEMRKCEGVESVLTAVTSGPELMTSPEFSKMAEETNKTEVAANGQALVNVDQVLVGPPKVAKLGRKRKTRESFSPEILTSFGQGAANGLEKCKSGKKWKRNENSSESPAALLLSFAPGITLPSKDDLISTFSKFGNVNEADTEVMTDSGCARVIFARSYDAEKALNSQDKTGLFAPPNASYRVRYLPGNSSPSEPTFPVSNGKLPYIRKNLERMISTLTGSGLPEKEAGSSEGSKSDGTENLVGEMQGLLEKVTQMLGGPPAGTSS